MRMAKVDVEDSAQKHAQRGREGKELGKGVSGSEPGESVGCVRTVPERGRGKARWEN